MRDSPVFRVEDRLVGEWDGQIVTAMTCIPFTVWVAGAPQKMLGLAGVVVAPEARRYGVASQLVVEGMRRSLAGGATLAGLYPFRHDFYASLGYAVAVERRTWLFNPHDMPVYPERERVRRARSGDLERVMASYDRVMRGAMLMAERSKVYWEQRVLSDGKNFLTIYEDEAGEVRGYFVFTYKDIPGNHMPRLVISEFLVENEEAKRGLFGFVAALRDQFHEVACTLPNDERLELRLANPRESGMIKGSIAELYGPKTLFGAMIRVLDVERALAARALYDDASGRVRVAIEDRRLPENGGAFDLTFDDGRLEVARADGDAPEHAASMSVNVFSQLYTGFATASEMRRAGILEADDGAVRLLDRAFAGPRPNLLDLF